MNFIYPNFLWALLGLFIPLAIHLWSKRKVRIIKIGSIRFLTEPDTRQSSSIQLNEWWLLALRMLAITFLSLILTGPHFKISAENVPVTYIVEPSLLGTESLQGIWDTLPEGSVRLLQPGFPEMNQRDTTDTVSPDYWQLAKEMETLRTDSIVVYTRALLNGLKGMRPAVDVPVHWVVINPDKAVKGIVEAQTNGTEIRLLSVTSDDRRLSFEKETLPKDNDRLRINPSGDSIWADSTTVPLIPEKQIGVQIFYNDSLVDQKEYILAALRAVNSFLNRKVAVHLAKDTDTMDISPSEYVIWLSTNPMPVFAATTLVYQPQEAGNSLIVEGPSSGMFYLTKHLDTENITEGHLTGKLIHFLNLHSGLNKKINDLDGRMASLEELATKVNPRRVSRHYTAGWDMVPWLWLLLGVTLFVERIVAKVRKQ